MVTLEQVKLLDTRVTKTVEYIKKLTAENSHLKSRLDSSLQRIEEMQALINRFKEDQGRIEEGILSALNRLNQFEDALGSILPEVSNSAESSLPADEPLPDPINGTPMTGEKSSGNNQPARKKTAGAEKIQNQPQTRQAEEPDEPSPVIELDIF
ncbi:MAG: cell division protein ZapB [Treponema sp.]|nr:cell division protein ZapB [Treponema sp.]